MDNTYLLKLIFFLVSLCAVFYFAARLVPKRKSRHERKQDQARRVIEKINSFPEFRQKIAYLRKIDPFTFEELVLEGFERRGFTVIRNTRYTGDGGIDGRVYVNEQLCLIQAKRYTGYIATGHVRAFRELLEQNNCSGFFVHTGKTREGVKAAIHSDDRLFLISGQRLLDLIATEVPFTACPEKPRSKALINLQGNRV